MKIVAKMRRIAAAADSCWHGRRQKRYLEDLSFSHAANRFADRNEFYGYMLHYYRHLCPAPVRAHRTYFRQDQRGFGEDAFHAMWWMLLREFTPYRCLEIGVYRGQVISLWSLIARMVGYRCEVHGISPFTPLGDGVSSYSGDFDYLADTLSAFDAMHLPHPLLVRALSTDLSARQHVSGYAWDLIYIDGSHDYDVVLADYTLARDNLKPGGILVMDDSSAYTSFRPPRFSFSGHPGPSQVAAEFACTELTFMGAVGHENVYRKPDDHRQEPREGA